MNIILSRPILYGILAPGLLLLSSVQEASGGEPFTSLSFEQARKKAQDERKLVFVDFHTTWCAPCRMMDRTTWKDEKVIAWLSRETIPLKVDAEREKELAGRYRINSYPTLLFLEPDGTEKDRLTGFHSAAEFLEAADGILAGKDAIARAAEKLEQSGRNDPMARLQYARVLAGNGRNEEALEHYLWCFDEGLKHSISFTGVRLSFLLSDIADLGRSYPPALAALRVRRDAARSAILSGRDAAMRVMDFTALNNSLGAAQDSLALYDQLRTEQPTSRNVAHLRESLMEELLEHRRYADIADGVDLEEKTDQLFEMHKPSWIRSLFTLRYSREEKERIREAESGFLVRQIGRYYQVLIGLGRLDEAEALAQRLLDLDPSARTYNELAWNGYLTGAPTEANLDQARQAYDISQGQNAAIVDTLARVLHARGEKPEAIALVRRSMKQLTSNREQEVLRRCLADLGGSPVESRVPYGMVAVIGTLVLIWVLRRSRSVRTAGAAEATTDSHPST